MKPKYFTMTVGELECLLKKYCKDIELNYVPELREIIAELLLNNFCEKTSKTMGYTIEAVLKK
jgi:hypothetical protein